MEIQNVALLHNEIVACGVNISGADSSGNVHIYQRPTCPEGEELTWTDPTDNLVALVLAAHEQPLTSDECLALQAALTEEQWAAYQDARKAPIRAQRAERYKQEADPLILSSLETALVAATPTDGVYQIVLPEEAVTNWVSVKNSIREELSYPE